LIEDIYDPLVRYRDEFRARFSQLTLDKFKELVEKSGVDVSANRKLIADINALSASLNSKKWKLFFLRLFIIIGFIAGFLGGIIAYNMIDCVERWYAIGACVGGIALIILTYPFYKKTRKLIEKLEDDISVKTQSAWDQMAPLNKLYTWDITVKLIEATVPRLQFDAFFTADRLDELNRLFGWDNSFNEGKSIVFAQSGVINGNPFVIGEYLEQQWGEKTYEGTKSISWSEWTTVNGKRQRVTRHQTLYATVTKPIPVYKDKKLLIYGNDAAENLTFSRKPSSLSDVGDGLIGSFRKKLVVRELEKFSRNLDDNSDFTLMSNHEFEALFYAKDRDNEVEFRLLFTALAQKQMLDLLKDSSIAFGDDFSFIKQNKINVIVPNHLQEAVIDTNPERFYDYDFDRAMLNFQQFNEKYFKDVYFAFAPLLAIPLYQQTRTVEDIYKDAINMQSSFWEHESLANYYGDDYFKHSSCITRNILKTEHSSREDDTSTIKVTAYGFKGLNRVDYVDVYGGDGRYHSVPVHWVEYLPVHKTSNMYISENKNSSDINVEDISNAGFWRRSIFSYLNK